MHGLRVFPGLFEALANQRDPFVFEGQLVRSFEEQLRIHAPGAGKVHASDHLVHILVSDGNVEAVQLDASHAETEERG